MCAFFKTLIIWILTSDFRSLLEHKISCSSLPLPSFISFFLQALIDGLLWWWASSRLIFSLKWCLLSLFLSPFRYHSSSKKQRNPLMKKILGLQSPMELTSNIYGKSCKIDKNFRRSKYDKNLPILIRVQTLANLFIQESHFFNIRLKTHNMQLNPNTSHTLEPCHPCKLVVH